MKTTVEIADSLFEEAKACAEARRVTLRQLIEEGLRTVIKGRGRRKRFQLRDGSFGGRGLKEDISWPEIRKRIYQGRGE